MTEKTNLWFEHDGVKLQMRRGVVPDCGGGYCHFYDAKNHLCTRPPAVPDCKERDGKSAVFYQSIKDAEFKAERSRMDEVLGKMRESLPPELWTDKLDELTKGYRLRAFVWQRLVNCRGCGTYYQLAHSVWLACMMDCAGVGVVYKARFAVALMEAVGMDREKAESNGEEYLFKNAMDYLRKVADGVVEWDIDYAKEVLAESNAIVERTIRIRGAGLDQTAFRFMKYCVGYGIEAERKLLASCMDFNGVKYFDSVRRGLDAVMKATDAKEVWSDKLNPSACVFIESMTKCGNPFLKGREA